VADRSAHIEVRGLREFERAIRAVDGRLAAELRSALRAIAEQVAADARSRVTADVGAGPAAASITPRAGARGASIAAGGRAAPYLPWLDFGGSVGRGHRPGVAWSGAVKREWRGRPVGEGRYLYPAIRANRDAISRLVDEAVERVAEDAGFETRGRA
jgi:hypothetical protein